MVTEKLIVNRGITGDSVCTEVTRRSSTIIYVVIPLTYLQMSDCICPALILPNQECSSLGLCHCAADTSFINSLELCLNGVNLEICISSNVQDETNNTVLYLYELKPLSDCYVDQVYRKYIKALQIFIIKGEGLLMIVSRLGTVTLHQSHYTKVITIIRGKP